jgi:ATP-dependent Clp protease adaptor protein ClpS
MNPSPDVRRPLTRLRVVLLKTPDKELLFIVRAIMELMRFARAEATQKMWEAYHRGRALLLVTHLERAELYQEQFADRGLDVSLEPA